MAAEFMIPLIAAMGFVILLAMVESLDRSISYDVIIGFSGGVRSAGGEAQSFCDFVTLFRCTTVFVQTS